MANLIFNKNSGLHYSPRLYPNARDPDWADADPSGVEGWVENYDGLWLHRITEDIGATVIVDSGPNAFDLDTVGTPDFDEPAVFGSDPSVAFIGTEGARKENAPEPDGVDVSYVVAYKRENSLSPAYLIDIDAAGSDRFILAVYSSRWRIYSDGAWQALAVSGPLAGDKAFLVVVQTSTHFHLYRAGFLLDSFAKANTKLGTPNDFALGISAIADSQACSGNYGINGAFNMALTAADVRQMSLDYGASPSEGWWYHTDVVDIGGDTDVWSHYAIESNVIQLLYDATGQGNSVTFGATYFTRVDPIESGSTNALRITSAGDVNMPDLGEPFATNWTLRLGFRITSMTSYNGILGFSSFAAYGIGIYSQSNGTVTARVRNVAGTWTQSTASGYLSVDQTIGVVMRHNAGAQTVDWWLDGVKQTAVNYTASATTLSGVPYFGQRFSSYSPTRTISLPTAWAAAKSDEECAGWSTITAP